MSEPKRIQRKRTKGWRMPEGAVYVGRPTKWGNPFVVYRHPSTGRWLVRATLEHYAPDERGLALAYSVLAFRQWLERPPGWGLFGVDHPAYLRSIPELAGRDLACWCPLDQPCHADVLLELANPTTTPAEDTCVEGGGGL